MIKTIERAIKVNRANKGLSAMKHPGDEILAQLKSHEAAINERLSSAEFARHIISTEYTAWQELEKQAKDKLSKATAANRAALARLVKIAETSVEKYETRIPELNTIVSALESTKKRVASAISVIVVDQNLRSVSGMFSIDSFEQIDFNFEKETQEIRKLCYTADAFLELES